MSSIDWEKGVIEKPKNSSETDWDSGKITEPAKDRGFTGALIDGAKSTGRAISSTYNTYTGDGQAVVDNSKEQELANEDKSQDIKNFQSDWAANTGAGTDDEVGLWGAIKGTGKAIIDNPRGAALSVVEQFPNSVPTLAAGWAGAKGGAMAGGAVGSAFGGVGAGPGALIGGAAGFVGGMFLGNTLTETGHKAQEYAADGEFTPDEQSAAMTEGAKKAGAITAVDAITFGIGGKISSTMRRTAENAVEAATRKTLIDAGVDISDAAAVSAARSSQQVAKSVFEAQQNAAKIADSLRKRAAEAGVLLTVETIGEGLGEYLGELAATGQASVSEAVLESFLSLGQSSVQSMFNFAKAREKSLTEQEWIDASNGIAPEGMAPEQMPVADGIWDKPTPEAKIDMGQMQGGGVTPAPVFDQQDIDSKLGATPSQQMGINPDAGPLSAAAAQSVDSGLFTGGFTPQAGINQTALEREGVTPPPVLDADQIDRNLGSIDPITGEYMPAPELLDQPNQAVNTGNYEYDRYGNLSKVDGRTVEGYGQNQPRLGFNNKAERSTAPLYEVGPDGVARPTSGETARSRKERIDLSTLEGRQQTQAQKQSAAMPEQRTPEQSAQHSWDSMNTFERNAAAANILGARGVLAKNTATKAWNKLSAEQQAKLVSGLDAQKGQRWTDPNQKVTDQTGPVLQNRDRTSQDSINQMRGISNNPDYSRLKTSGFLSDGAPVAIDENIKVPGSQLGVTDTASAGGKKFNVQYAVVEADQFVTSNSIDGRPNTEYAAGSAGKARAIAGNGRITGLQSAWAKGKADQYKADMAADKMHGIDAAVIEEMKNPILVRLLPQDEVTDNIGDLSNRDEKGKLSPVEQAKTDMGRIDLDSLKFTAEGAIGGEAIHQFRMAQPAAERVSEAEARKRLTSAIFQKAYGSDQLTDIQAGESEDAKSIMSALAQAAPSMSRLEGAGEFDVRPIITQAGIAAVNAARRGTRLADYVQQSEMGIDPNVYPVLEMMLNEKGNIRSSKYIGEQLTNMAKLAYDEANSPGSDMFGDKPKRTGEQVIQDALTGVQGYGQINDGSRQESLGQRGGAESDAQMVERPEGGRERPADTGQIARAEQEAEQGQPAKVENNAPEKWRTNYLQAAKIARDLGIDPKQHKKLADLVAAIDAFNAEPVAQQGSQAPTLDLTQQAEETLAAEAERLEQLQKEEAAQKAKQKAAESKARERDADKSRADEVVDDFQLGQQAEEVMSGMGDIFATESKPADKGIAAQDNDSQVTVADDQYNPNPTEAQKQAGNYKKAHVKFQGIDITIENPVGSERSGVDPDGNTWSNTIKHDYGYIKRTTGADGDHVDVFIGKDTDSDKVFVIDQPHKNGKFDEHKVMLGFKGRTQAVAAYKGNYQKGWKVGPITEMTVGEFKQWLSNGDTTKPVETVAKPAAEQAKPNQAVEDYGEKMAGAIKDQPINSLSKDLTDEEIASMPLSKVWPVGEPLSIKDDYAAAFSYAARENIPAKPRLKYKVKRWVYAVKSMRELAKAVQDGEITKDNIDAVSKVNDAAKSLAAKAGLLSGLDRKHWSRIGRVDVSDNAYIFDDNRNKVPSPHTTIMVDGRGVLVKGKYDNDSVTAVIKASLEMAEKSGLSKRAQFEIRSYKSSGEIFINRKGDKELRKLKTFPKGAIKEAREFVNNNTDELVAEWEAIKERDNVTKADVRSDTNRERSGIDYRNGKNVTSEEFGETFGFRGVEFGNWVSQGKGQKDRQGMLNAAYDALLDLAAVVGVPPKAISLNGSLGIAFGSRGKGKYSAHYETNNIVINLTKTKGAGSLAHEWFHALDNYFSRRRGVTPFEGDQLAYNKANYITYKPEPMMALKTSLNKQGLRSHLITKAEYDRRAERGVNFDAADWTPDTNHPIGVRPVVEKAFADLVSALDESPMLGRAETIDKGQVEGYWSRIIERAARSFESYVIQRLEDQGITNDYLANVVPVEQFQRDKGRYPYLTAEELKPVAEKFDTLFRTIETREEISGNFLMFSRSNNQPNSPTNNASLLRNINENYPALTGSVVTMLQRGSRGQKGGLVIVDSNNGGDIAKAYSKATGMPIAQANRLFSDGESINGFYDTNSGITFLVGPNLDATTAPAVLLHEVTHSQQRSEIDARSMKLINGRANEKNADLKAFLETVSQRMIDAGEYGNPLESTTYIVEQAITEGRSQGYTLADSKFFNAIEKTLGATVASIVRDFTKMVRQFALRRGLPINITLDDLVQYAMASVEQAAKGNIATENKDGMAYSFAGEDALTADLASLAEAKKQIATDLTPDQVRKNTGWMQGAEGRWRFEIDDSKASFVDAPMLDSYLSNTLTGDKKLSAADQKTLNLLKLKERKMSAELFGAKDKKTDAWDHLFYDWHLVKQQIQELDRRAGGDFMNIGSLLKHDQLFNAHPDMKNIKIRLAVDDSVTMNGFYDRKDNLIEMTAPNKEKLMAGLLHELQHAIQSIEGFARGGSPSQFDYKDATSEYLGRVSNKIIDLLNSNKEFGAAVRKVKQEFTKLSNKYPQATKDGQESVNWDKVPTDESEAYFKLLDQTEKHPEVERWHDLETEYRIARRDGKTLTPFEQYQSLAGEVEARNVESRRHFTEEERREFSPIASEDFQRQDQTIRYSRNAKARVEGEQQFAQTEKAYGGRAAYDQAKSEGKTKLNYQQWVQVRTPAFIEWFGDWQNVQQTEKQKGPRDPRSNNEPAGRPEQTATAAGTGEAGGRQDHGRGTRIPDILIEQSTGEPKVFYHGTRDSFEAFDLDHPNRKDAGWLGRGAYAASDARMANTYAKLKDGDGSPNVMPLFIRSTGSVYQVDPLEKQKLSQAGQDNIDAVTRRMIANGFDGAYVEHSDSVEIATFSPNNVKSASGNAGTFSAATDDIRFSRAANPASVHAAPNGMAAWDSPSASKVDDFIYKIQDKHVDTKRVIEAIRDTGKAISDDLDVYLQETLFHGRAAKRTQDFLNKEVNPLIEYMQSAKVDMSDLEEFLHARHAQEANALIAKRDPNMPDGGSGMTNAEAAKYLNSLNGVRRKQLENAAKFVDKIIGGTRETIVSYGLESQETVDGWTAGFKHYIPLQREDKDGQMGIGQGFSVKGKETKGRTGSTRKVVDILANVMMQRERAIVRGEKNRVAVALLGLAKDNPRPEFWQVDKVPTTRVLDKTTGLVRNQADPMYKSRDNAVVAKVNGQEHAILMNEDDARAMRMAEALKNLDAAQLEGLLGATATATRYFAAVNTQYNPIFGVTNFVRDIQEAMLHLQSTPLAGQQARLFKNTFTAVGAVMKAERDGRKGNNATGKWGVLWEDFQNTGGQTGFRDQFSSSADRGDAIKNALTPGGWADTGLGKLFTAGGVLKVPLEVARKKAVWLFDLLSDYNTAMENGVRLSAYETGINAGMSKEQAAALAKGLTVNFNRKGQVTQQVGALYAFFNASVQGTARLGQSLFDMDAGKPKMLRLSSLGKKIVSGGVMLGASQAVLLAMAGFDDEEPPEFIRERNIIIPTGGKTYISIPMPLGYHVIANLGRIPMEFVLGGGKDGAKYLFNLMDVMADIYNPIGNSGLSMQTIAPTVLDPLAGLAENKDFSGRAIAKESFNRQTPGHALARDTASLPATWLAELVNYATGGTEFTRGELSPTPDQIDYLVGQLTGGVGRETTKFMKSIQATATGDDLPWHNIPLAGRFFGDADSDGAKQSAFYNSMDKVRKHAEEVKGLRASGRSGEAVEYANKHPHAKLHLAARAAEKQVKDMRDRKRDLEQAGAPREEIRALEKRMIQRMEQFVELSAVRK